MPRMMLLMVLLLSGRRVFMADIKYVADTLQIRIEKEEW
jgi:hypothetical protein